METVATITLAVMLISVAGALIVGMIVWRNSRKQPAADDAEVLRAGMQQPSGGGGPRPTEPR